MAEKRKMKKRKEDPFSGNDPPEKPSKEEYAIAKWLRSNVPNKKTKFANYSVEYFTAVKAVDALMESHWAKSTKKDEEPMFASRQEIVDFLDIMLRHKFFHRAKKVVVSQQELKGKHKKKDEEDKEEKKKEKDKKTADDVKKGTEDAKKNVDAESSHAEGSKDDKASQEGKEVQRKKRKIRLEMHMEQLFVDGLDAYVWIYDPIPFYYWVFGTLVVLGSIGICVFPLWPPSVRKGVYYLSVAAAGFLLLILALALLRVVVFCIIWTLTLGKHHLWLLPNLVEDVGFLASFWPLYKYEYRGGENSESIKEKKKKKKKDKESDAEDDGETEEKRDVDTGAEETGADDDTAADGNDTDRRNSDVGVKDSESESESSSQKSTTGRDFEMVEREDAEDSTS